MPEKLITIDGPSGVGKGTVSQRLAHTLGWQWLDSGMLYRVVAYAAIKAQVPCDDIDYLVNIATDLDVTFSLNESEDVPTIILSGESIGAAIRNFTIGQMASKISAHPPVRAALLKRQRDFYHPAQGLVTDGRDMGTIIFPEAPLKFFLDASPEERARRRHKQLIRLGQDVKMPDLLAQIVERDKRDKNRPVAPLRPAKDAVVIDTTTLSVDAVYALLLARVRDIGLLC